MAPDSSPAWPPRPLRRLAAEGFELALLAVLVVEGWKPLARWEHPLPPERHDDLAALGLSTRRIRRHTPAGALVHETVLSRHVGLLELYAEAFDGTSLRIDTAQARLEGWLFGFPPCCVMAYVEHGYAPNTLPPGEQAELFHWACPGCAITPRILPHHRDIVRRLRALLATADDAPAP